ncbi:MAG: hydrolase [Sporichthyaceae bacterium]|nr:hydrolase [Sporichthyaceae bacterium]
MDGTVEIETPVGPARAVIAAAAGPAAAGRAPTTLVLGHGAGGGSQAPDLVTLARRLPELGITVIRVEQPWRVAGKKVAPQTATLDRAWSAVLAELAVEGLLVVGGRSAGARVACRTALAIGACGVVALAFPLHPPGRPERSRADELINAGVPTLVVQGSRDNFGGPGEFPAGTELRPVDGADHGFRIPKSAELPQAAALAAVATDVAAWIERLAGPG